jgi:hypothetical protein
MSNQSQPAKFSLLAKIEERQVQGRWKRVVIMAETDPSERIVPGVLKSLTGGDAAYARSLNAN